MFFVRASANCSFPQPSSMNFYICLSVLEGFGLGGLDDLDPEEPLDLLRLDVFCGVSRAGEPTSSSGPRWTSSSGVWKSARIPTINSSNITKQKSLSRSKKAKTVRKMNSFDIHASHLLVSPLYCNKNMKPSLTDDDDWIPTTHFVSIYQD